MNKRSAQTSIIIWSIVLGAVILLFITFFSVRGFYKLSFWENDWNEASIVTIKEESIPESISTVLIDWTWGNVTLYKTDEKEIKLIQKAQNKKVSPLFSHVSGNSLSIRDAKEKSFFIFNLPHRTDLELYLPQKIYDSFSFTGTMGNLNCDFLETKLLQIDSTSGKIDLSGKFKEAEFNLTSGSIRCDDFIADSLSLEMTSGEADFEGSFKEIDNATTSGDTFFASDTMIKQFKSDTTSGTTGLSIPENDGFTLDIEKVSGDFSSEFGTSQTDDDTYVYKNGAGKMDVKIVSGDFSLLKN